MTNSLPEPRPEIAWDDRGLVPAVVQDAATGAVLMLGYMNREALQRTLASQEAWFWSRSRQAFWRKGETSGNTLHVTAVTLDCDGDALLVQAHPAGPTCHTGSPSCFQYPLQGEIAPGAAVLGQVLQVLRQRKRDLPEGSYTTKLFQGGVDRIGKKVIEEAGEVVIAAKNPDREALVGELADLWFHSLVLLAEQGLELDEVFAELARRQGLAPRPGSA